jgi:hypothetical protein
MASRKIFNYESVILRDLTVEREGHSPDDFGPSSAKFIWATCRFCGQPSRIRKGFYVKAGSACHNECRLKEQKQKSPFADPAVRAKARRTNLKRYGVEHASQNADVAKKIAATKQTEESKEKTASTNLQRYGTVNPAQSDEVKNRIVESNLSQFGVAHPMQNESVKKKARRTVQKKYGVDNVMKVEGVKRKVRETNIQRYGVENAMQNEAIAERARRTLYSRYGVRHPLQSEEIRRQVAATCMERYGVQHPMQFSATLAKAQRSFRKAVVEDKNEVFRIVALLRDESFWREWKEQEWTLDEVAEKKGVNAGSLRNQLVKSEFRDRYESVYTYPRNQSQKEVATFIRSLGLSVTSNTRKVIGPLELDIWCPDRKFAVEFNGSFWHSEAFMDSQTARTQHREKLEVCRKAGITLFTLFEAIWDSKRTQVEAFLRSALGTNRSRVHARKCRVTTDQGADLMRAHHIQGYPKNTIRTFDLDHNGEVVMSIGAARHHRHTDDKDTVILNRLVSAPGLNVQGGLSRLVGAFVRWAKHEGYKKIVTWSDNCWTEGRSYPAVGFSLVREGKPDYFYWDAKRNVYVSKQSVWNRSAEFPEGMSERKWAMTQGLYRIWDCGKKRWEFTLS